MLGYTNQQPMMQQPTQQSNMGGEQPPISLQEIDNQISQHQAIIDQLIQIREMLMGGALQRAGGGQAPGQFPFGGQSGNLQPNPQQFGR